MQSEDSTYDYSRLNEANPHDLRKVITHLIAKSKLLVDNLDNALAKVEKSQGEKNFWKDSYFQLKESCERYIDANGISPFCYIAILEDELKRQKMHKSCLIEKLGGAIRTQNQQNQRQKSMSVFFGQQLPPFSPNMKESLGNGIYNTYGSNTNSRKRDGLSQEYHKFQSTVKRNQLDNRSMATIMPTDSPHTLQNSKSRGKDTVGPKKIEMFQFGQGQQ